MSDIETVDGKRIKQFVRESLGCTCPDEVFEHIRIVKHADAFAVANIVYEIGGRLLVAVLIPETGHELSDHLGQLVDAGLQYRDQHGYNRFRLVLATHDDAEIKHLQPIFDSQPGVDDKAHLHVIAPELLPFDVPT